MKMDDFNDGKLYNCDICEAENFSHSEMINHMKEHKGLPSCPFCDLADITPEEMTLHVNSIHLKSPPQKKTDPETDDNKTTTMTTNPTGEYFNDDVRNNTALPQCSSGRLTLPHGHSEEHNQIADLNKNIYKSSSDTSAQSLYNVATSSHNCPMCVYETDCPNVLLVHINQAHFQDTPEKKSSGINSRSHVENIEEKERPCMTSLENEKGTVKSFSSQASGISQSVNSDIEMVSVEQEDSGASTSCDINRTPSKDGAVSCPFCDTEYKEHVSLQFHIRGSHESEIEDMEPLNFAEELNVPLCPICQEKFPDTEMSLLEAHVNSHFTASTSTASAADSLQQQENKRREEQAKKFKAVMNKGTTSKSSGGVVNKEQGVKSLKTAVGRGQRPITNYYTNKQELLHANTTGVDEGNSCTKELVPRLQQFLVRQTGRYLVRHWLASHTDHYAGSYGDRGWGCGYRNLQMLLSCLVKRPEFQQPVFNGVLKIPSIAKLQQLIEDAWSQGYDPQGRQQLKKLLYTNKWIGATEIYAVLASLKVKCRLVDFYAPTGPGNTHPQLFQWVKKFYSNCGDFKPPLYLQHQGHSRTIVGIEEYKDGSLKLLIFDPGTPKSQMSKLSTGDIDNNKMKTLRRTLNGLKASKYQVVAVQGLLTSAEQEKRKLLTSERIP